MTNPTHQDDEVTAIRNEVFRKVGRNLYIFQQIEALLKHLNVITDLSGPVSQIRAITERKVNKSYKSNMGPLVKNLVENIYTTAERIKLEEDANENLSEIKELHIRTRFNRETTPEYIATRKKILNELVAERNQLVHHLFNNVKHDSVELFVEIDSILDEQRERIVAEHEYLRVMVKEFADAAKAHDDFIHSTEGKHHLDLMFIQQSSLVQKLSELAISSSDKNGWIPLAHAGNQVKSIYADDLDHLKKQFGLKTLKDILIASKVFDLKSEQTNKGGERWLYKLKNDTDESKPS
jgi:hypothetical protein